MILDRSRRRLCHWTLAIPLAALSAFAVAHDSSVGDIHIVHAFATPSLAGSSNGAAYFATLENTGDKPGACTAYGVVMDRWKNAKPRSIVLEKSRARAKALGCPK